MTKITTIGITSPCGGNGCTTLAVHLAWFAAQRRGIRTLAVSMDRTGALVRHFLPDMGLRVDSFGRISETLNACYFDVEATVSKLLPTLGLSKDEYPSLIVVDLGCGMSSDLLTDVDLWLTPVADVRTMRALLDTGYPRSGQGKTYIAFNRSGGSQYAKRLLAQAGDRCTDLLALRAEIPHSGAVQRASLHYETVWQHSPESRAAANLKTWAYEVLELAMPKWQADEELPDAVVSRVGPIQHGVPIPGVSRVGPALEPLLPTFADRDLKRQFVELLRQRVDEVDPVPGSEVRGFSQTGRWVRAERMRLGLACKKTAKLLGITEFHLRTVEAHDHVVPTAWLSMLAILGFQPKREVDEAACQVAIEPVAEPTAYRPAPAPAPAPTPAPEPLLPIGAAEGPVEYDVVNHVPQLLAQEAAQNDQSLAQAAHNDHSLAASSPEQEVVPTKALSIRRSTPKIQLPAKQVKPRKSVRSLSGFDLQERLDATYAKLEAVSRGIAGKRSRLKPR